MRRARTLIEVLMALLALRLSAQQAGPLAVGHGYRGETTCVGGVPHSAQLAELVAQDSAETAAHEAIHRRQLAPNCDSVLAVWAADPRAKLEAEAEAFCGGMRAAEVPRAWWHARAVRVSAWWVRWSNALGFDEYLAAFDRWCG